MKPNSGSIKWVVGFLGALAILYLGFFVGGHYASKGTLTFESKVSLDNLITSFITVGVALLVAKVLEKRESDTRTEKDLFLGKINRFDEDMRSLSERLDSNIFDRGFVITALKNLRGYLNLLQSGLQRRNYPLAVKQCKEIDVLLASLRDETTDDVKCPTLPSGQNSELKAKYADTQQHRFVGNLCGKISESILELSLCINSH